MKNSHEPTNALGGTIQRLQREQVTDSHRPANATGLAAVENFFSTKAFWSLDSTADAFDASRNTIRIWSKRGGKHALAGFPEITRFGGKALLDVRAVWNGSLPVAFEVQLSTTFLRVIAGRRDFYLKNGGLLLWVFESFDMGDAKTTQDDVFYNNNRNAFVASPKTLEASRLAGKLTLDCIWSEPEVLQGQLMWSQQRRMAPFSEFVVEQDRQRVYLYDADGEREKVEAEARDRPLRADFRRYWLREPFVSDQKQWEAMGQRFRARNIGFPRYLGDAIGLRPLLDSLYSAREGTPVGWRHANLVKVAHHVFDVYKGHLWAFKLLLSAHDRGAQFLREDDTTKWRRVKVPAYTKAWEQADPAFMPDRRYDDLVEFLFPEIAKDLSKTPTGSLHLGKQ